MAVRIADASRLSPRGHEMQLPTIIIHPDHVSLTDEHGATISIRGKWVALYRVLYLGSDGSLDRAAVATIPGWSSSLDDIGRELSRHLRRAKACRLQPPPLLSARPTMSWERNPHWSVAVSRDCKDVADIPHGRVWLAGIKAGQELAAIRWAIRQTDAHLEFLGGSLKVALGLAQKAAAVASCGDLIAVSNLLALRVAWRLEPDDATLDLIDDCEDAVASLAPGAEVSALRRNVLERLTLMKSLHASRNEWPALIHTLSHRLGSTADRSDLLNDTLAANYLAVTLRRAGRASEALTIITRALCAAVSIGDVHLIQSVLFNAGHILLEIWRVQGPEELCHDAVAALELVSRITVGHGIGGDSAQNEILIADLKIAQGNPRDAEPWLTQAHRIIESSRNTYDRACLAHVELRLDRALGTMTPRAGDAFHSRVSDVAGLYTMVNREDLADALHREFVAPGRQASL